MTKFTPMYGKVISIGEKVIMADGSLCDETSISWWYEGDEEDEFKDQHLAYVMDFSKHFPYWEELKPPEGYNHVVEIEDVWYWAIREKNF
jgi:hypothetical protein